MRTRDDEPHEAGQRHGAVEQRVVRRAPVDARVARAERVPDEQRAARAHVVVRCTVHRHAEVSVSQFIN